MKVELDKYQENQIYLRNDGKFIWINSVDPISKIKTYEKDRYCFYYEGRIRVKSDEFNDDLFIIENGIDNISMTFDVKNNHRITLSEFRDKEVAYIGMIVPEKVAQFVKRREF